MNDEFDSNLAARFAATSASTTKSRTYVESGGIEQKSRCTSCQRFSSAWSASWFDGQQWHDLETLDELVYVDWLP